LIGGILTLILLNSGVTFFFGGLRSTDQFYNPLIATVFNGLLSVSIAVFVMPTVSFYLSATAIPVTIKQSRRMATILMAIYGLYLYFELLTHADGFNEKAGKSQCVRERMTFPQEQYRRPLPELEAYQHGWVGVTT